MSYMAKILHPLEPSMDNLHPGNNIQLEKDVASSVASSKSFIESSLSGLSPELTKKKDWCSFQSKRGYLILTLVILLFISILVVLFLVSQISSSIYFGNMNYPSWAPRALMMTLIGFFTFAFGTFGFIFLNNDNTRRFIPYILGLMIAEVLSLVLFFFFMYSTGSALIAVFVMALVLLVELYIMVFLGLKRIAAMWFQIPYFLFLLLLLTISIFMAVTDKV